MVWHPVHPVDPVCEKRELLMPKYPVIDFLLRHGHPFAIAVALLPAIGGAGLACLGWGWPIAAGGVLAGGILYVLAKSYVELVAIIADMLLPK